MIHRYGSCGKHAKEETLAHVISAVASSVNTDSFSSLKWTRNAHDDIVVTTTLMSILDDALQEREPSASDPVLDVDRFMNRR